MKSFLSGFSLRTRLALIVLSMLCWTLLALARPWPGPILAGILAGAGLCAWLGYRLLLRMIMLPLQDIGAHLCRIADGDLSTSIEIWTRDEIGSAFQSIKDMQDSLKAMITATLTSNQQMQQAAQNIVAGNLDLTRQTEQSSSALKQTANSVEQLLRTIGANTDHAHQANQLARQAADVANQGGSAVDGVVLTMEGITDSSQKIADIVGIIDSIAFQTNILALNASVEAARAGEQGRGFAVVAAEVQGLSQRSATAAQEIRTLIDLSSGRVSAGMAQVRQAGATMREVVQVIVRASALVEEITAMTEEQATDIGRIHQAMTALETVTEHNAQLAQQATETANTQKGLAIDVNLSLSAFRLAPGGLAVQG